MGYQRLLTAACLCEFMDERTRRSGQGSPGGSGAPATINLSWVASWSRATSNGSLHMDDGEKLP